VERKVDFLFDHNPSLDGAATTICDLHFLHESITANTNAVARTSVKDQIKHRHTHKNDRASIYHLPPMFNTREILAKILPLLRLPLLRLGVR
jgi:hypothetical protein